MSTPDYETVELDINSGIATISLNRPDCLNAMNRQLIDDVALAFDEANRDDAAKVVIFTGKGRAFCAGDDRNEHVHPENEAEARELVEAIQRATHSCIWGKTGGGGYQWLGRWRWL